MFDLIKKIKLFCRTFKQTKIIISCLKPIPLTINWDFDGEAVTKEFVKNLIRCSKYMTMEQVFRNRSGITSSRLFLIKESPISVSTMDTNITIDTTGFNRGVVEEAIKEIAAEEYETAMGK